MKSQNRILVHIYSIKFVLELSIVKKSHSESIALETPMFVLSNGLINLLFTFVHMMCGGCYHDVDSEIFCGN